MRMTEHPIQMPVVNYTRIVWEVEDASAKITLPKLTDFKLLFKIPSADIFPCILLAIAAIFF